ncbi:hypothetical protein HMPREF9080_00239 [Cardiobacterium valvarum F0432]|uniref:Uncharacterized protein n=1 Tax=Cardiobacterium valvarum F0432 TaxID=797473 RepID=G9ZBW2_9GAMM|nr:hypothetical protein HMPREF9080_00239 [Cardiobacterium valvarum F0432]
MCVLAHLGRSSAGRGRYLRRLAGVVLMLLGMVRPADECPYPTSPPGTPKTLAFLERGHGRGAFYLAWRCFFRAAIKDSKSRLCLPGGLKPALRKAQHTPLGGGRVV